MVSVPGKNQIIWKWMINKATKQKIALPTGAVILSVQEQHDRIVLWTLCNPEAPTEIRVLFMYDTGMPIEEPPGKHISTIQAEDGDLILHVFEAEL